MKLPAWLNRADCVGIHEMVLAQHGGLAGIRDEGLLESALNRPRNLLAYGSASLSQMAAGYAAGIIQNHPFLDGNKRTGFMLATVFMELNGHIFEAAEESVVENTLALAAGDIDEAGYALWLQSNSTGSDLSFTPRPG